MCVCDASLVLLGVTRVESFLRQKYRIKAAGLGAMIHQIPALETNVRVALQIITNIRNRFCHHSPKFLNPIERERFMHNLRLVNVRFGIKMPETEENEVIVIDEEDEENWTCNKCNKMVESTHSLCPNCFRGTPRGQWMCTTCTCVNPDSESVCTICTSKRPIEIVNLIDDVEEEVEDMVEFISPNPLCKRARTTTLYHETTTLGGGEEGFV